MLVEKVEYVEIKVNGRVFRLKAPQIQRLPSRDPKSNRVVYLAIGMAEEK